ncbi:cache domain-containing protein [Paracoccus sp. Z330]|uniref:histidine kinase n=1 Tax=Paracoccus onchidii TaxID=3017813 RepID=A0ABT4ZJX2_9RHOB|nr:PAS domain-containing sensor histidine kinase [Paracoccus onchidii]MDB6179357.1 cache domain-containing protein [Paracoccus onchidii]
MRLSLSALLAFGLAGLQFLAVLAVVFSSYVTSERALLEHARSLLSDVGTNTAEHSKGFLDPARGAAELAARLAQHKVVASEDTRQLELFLFQQLQITPQFSGLYFGGEDGTFVYVMRSDGPAPYRSKLITFPDGQRKVEFVWRDVDFSRVEDRLDPEDKFDPRDRPWYSRAKEKLTTIWTDPYIFFSSQEPGITLAAPVRDGPKGIRGVVGVDIEISNISQFLSRLNIGQNGRALIINRNGDVIAHPDQSLIKVRDGEGTLRFVNIEAFDDPIARAAFADLAKSTGFPVKQEVFHQFGYDGHDYIANVLPVVSEQMPWTIAVYAPQDDFIGEIKRNRADNIWIAALVAIITGLAGLWLAKYIYRPVRAFAVRSALVSQGEADPSEPLPRTYRELSQANETLVQQIVARKKAEREYGQTFNLSSRAMAQISPQSGRFLKVNSKLCEISGYNADELLSMCYKDLIAPQDKTTMTPLAELSEDTFSVKHDTRVLRKDGSILHLAVNAILIRDQDGNPLHAVVTLDDITAIKAQENEIARLNRDLSHLARGNTMGQMAAGLAHELNQPLSAIAQNADSGLLIVDNAGNSAPELREILGEIEEQSLRAGEIIRALRGFISKDEIHISEFNLAELLEQANRLVQAEATEADVAILSQLPDDLPKVRANRIQIAQVLVNLLRNAIEAISEADAHHRKITVRAMQIGKLVEVQIEDTGPGVSTEINLFAQFETTKKSGMGLGLSICRSMIDANGGTMWLDRSYRDGARFHFTIPIGDGGATLTTKA